MSNKNDGNREIRYESSGDPMSKVILAAALLFIAGGAAIKGGFALGEQVSNEVLRRRDRDIRRQERKERREQKEKIREEKRADRERRRQAGEKIHWYEWFK